MHSIDFFDNEVTAHYNSDFSGDIRFDVPFTAVTERKDDTYTVEIPGCGRVGDPPAINSINRRFIEPASVILSLAGEHLKTKIIGWFEDELFLDDFETLD